MSEEDSFQEPVLQDYIRITNGIYEIGGEVTYDSLFSLMNIMHYFFQNLRPLVERMKNSDSSYVEPIFSILTNMIKRILECFTLSFIQNRIKEVFGYHKTLYCNE